MPKMEILDRPGLQTGIFFSGPNAWTYSPFVWRAISLSYKMHVCAHPEGVRQQSEIDMILSTKRKQTTRIGCACGQTRLELKGSPILVSECLCNSCRAAAARLAALPGAKNILTSYGATACAEYRKDRVQFLSGTEHLKGFLLSADAGSRRVVASCCNTPIFLELKGAHWLSIYLHLWPGGTRPAVEIRTMVSDLTDASNLPND